MFTAILTTLLAGPAYADDQAEWVRVIETEDDNAIVQRKNGEQYLIEKGVGCLGLWRFKGKDVIITYGTFFGGVGSKLVLPGEDSSCRIWDAKEIRNPTSGGSTTSTASADVPSTVDGRLEAALRYFGLWTGDKAASIRAYQKVKGMEQTGVADVATAYVSPLTVLPVGAVTLDAVRERRAGSFGGAASVVPA